MASTKKTTSSARKKAQDKCFKNKLALLRTHWKTTALLAIPHKIRPPVKASTSLSYRVVDGLGRIAVLTSSNLSRAREFLGAAYEERHNTDNQPFSAHKNKEYLILSDIRRAEAALRAADEDEDEDSLPIVPGRRMGNSRSGAAPAATNGIRPTEEELAPTDAEAAAFTTTEVPRGSTQPTQPTEHGERIRSTDEDDSESELLKQHVERCKREESEVRARNRREEAEIKARHRREEAESRLASKLKG